MSGEAEPEPPTESNPPVTLVVTEAPADPLSSIEMFKACADPGRKKSLKSLEIPLDILLSGIAFLSGGHDRRNAPILSLTQPEEHQVEMLMEITAQDITDMLAYFTSVPKEDVRVKGFSVLVDADIIHDFLIRNMIKALHSLQMEDETHLFHAVYFVSSTKDCSIIDWAQECGEETIDLPFVRVKSYSDLEQFIDGDQLTKEFGGTLEYDHHDWVRFRMQVEPFICDCVSISKRLTRAIEPFTQEEVPRTIKEAEESLKHHKLTRRKTFDTLHMDNLASEGEVITERMETVRRTSKTFNGNPDFANTMTTVQKLLSQIETVKERVESLWSTRQEKLEANLKQKIFEKEAKQVIEWFEEYAEEFFQTNTELGESLDIAVALVMEVQQFESSTQQILQRTDTIIKSGSELESHPYADKPTVQWLMGKIKQLMTDFDTRLSKRKKKLDNSVKLHRLIETALDWCIESASLLSEHDIISANPLEIDPDFTQAEFAQFLDDCPGPSEEDLQQLLDLSEESESHWTKENALFAYNRVLEITERFRYYQRALDEMVADKRERERQEEEQKRELMQKSKRLLSAVDSLIGTVSGEGSPSLKKEQSIDSVFDHLEPRTDDDVSDEESASKIPRADEPDFGSRKRTHQTPLASLHYESDVDEALMLLESAVRNASDRLDTQRAAPPPGATEGGEYSSDEDPWHNHRLSKQDISAPTHTAGALFTGEEQPDIHDHRRLSLQEPEEDLTSQTKHAKHRRQLMEELITTEETYIRDMERVVEHYMPAMDNLDELPRNLVGKKNIIFSNIHQLLEFNRQVILPELQQCRKCPIKLGQIFLNFEEDFYNYSMYFKNMPLQKQLLEEGGIEFFDHVQHSLGDTFFLSSYLIKPFQRVARYKLFLQDMIKHSTRIDLKGKHKEYYDKLKDAHKMVDFILRHGNDLLAAECLKGFEGSLLEQGKVLRQGDLVVIERTKHRRRVFLFEQTIVFSKKKMEKHKPGIPGSEIFEFRQAFKTSDLSLRENIPGYPTRFELKKKKESIILQADTEEEKNDWVQDIWDLFFGHMLSLKDQNLEAYGTRPLTSIVASGTATLTRGRTLGRSMRKRLTIGSRSSREMRSSRPTSVSSSISATSRGSSTFDEVSAMIRPNRQAAYSPSSPRLSSTFVDLRAGKRLSGISITETEASDVASNRDSIVSSASSSTLLSLNLSGNNNQDPDVKDRRLSQLVSEVRKADDDTTSLSSEVISEDPANGGPVPANDDGPTPSSSLRLESESSQGTPAMYDTPV